MWQAGSFAQNPNHRIQRVGDTDDKCVRAVFLDTFADRFHDGRVDAKEIVTAHARLAGDASCYDDNIGTLEGGVSVGALDGAIKTFNRRRFRQVQRLALRNAFNNVEKNDISQFFKSCEMCKCSTNIAGADEGDLVACHVPVPLLNFCLCMSICDQLCRSAI